MDNNPIIRFLIEISIMSVHTWLIYSVCNYIGHGLEPTFESLGQIIVIVGIISILLGYLTGLNL